MGLLPVPTRVQKMMWTMGLPLLVAMLLLGAASDAMGQQRYRLQEGQWLKQATYAPGTPEAKLQDIRKALAEEQAEDAEELADAWIEEYPNHPMAVEAYLLRGDAKVAQDSYYDALFDYEYVLRQYPGSEQFNTALEREYQIARLFSNGMYRKFLGMSIVPAYEEAAELYVRIQERAPGSEIGEKASLELGDHYVRQADMTSAATAYEMFLLNYPRSAHREMAMLKVIQANLAIFKGPRFDATSLIEAGQRLRSYQTEFPAAAEQLGAGALLSRIDESMARKSYYTAQWYETRYQQVSALATYRRLIRDYPRTAAAQDAVVRLNELGVPVVVSDQATTAPATPATATAPVQSLPAAGVDAAQQKGRP